MSKIVELNDSLFESSFQERSINEVLLGLNKQEIGFLVASMETGKGYLCLSIAYELTTTYPFVEVTRNNGPKKVLYWCVEDGISVVAERVRNHFEVMENAMSSVIQSGLQLFEGEPICCSGDASNTDVLAAADNLMKLTEAAKEYDIVIIDTIREAVGTADEVKDDLTIKLALQTLAKNADVAVLVCHHLKKAPQAGLEKVTSVSASGFSRTLANSRIQLFMDKDAKQNKTTLSHIKANNLQLNNRLSGKVLKWTDSSLLISKDFELTRSEYRVSSPEEAELVTPKRAYVPKVIADEEPTVVNIDEAELSEAATKKAKPTSTISDKEKDELAKWLKNQNN